MRMIRYDVSGGGDTLRKKSLCHFIKFNIDCHIGSDDIQQDKKRLSGYSNVASISNSCESPAGSLSLYVHERLPLLPPRADILECASN